jgi:hypothetical protein
MKLKKFYGGVLAQPNDKYNIREHLNNDEIIQRLHSNGLVSDSGTAVNEIDTLTHIMQHLSPLPIDIIEIGTFMGVGTALLASYARSVATFDIWYRNSHHIWSKLAISRKINCYTGDQKFIDDVIKVLQGSTDFNFNFAFIDGLHEVNSVRHDFELVNFCDRVLFHDAHIPEIKDFIINEIGGIILEDKIFGYWERK